MRDEQPEGKPKIENLELNQETLADLAEGEAAQVKGGMTKPPNLAEGAATDPKEAVFRACRY